MKLSPFSGNFLTLADGSGEVATITLFFAAPLEFAIEIVKNCGALQKMFNFWPILVVLSILKFVFKLKVFVLRSMEPCVDLLQFCKIDLGLGEGFQLMKCAKHDTNTWFVVGELYSSLHDKYALLMMI